MDKSLGQVAYEAYGESTGWKTYNGNEMPRWEALGEPIQQAWEAAAEAARSTAAPVHSKILTGEEIRHRFQFHPADAQNTKDKHEGIRERAIEFGDYVVMVVPHGREQATAMTKLEELTFWANAGIARGDGPRT